MVRTFSVVASIIVVSTTDVFAGKGRKGHNKQSTGSKMAGFAAAIAGAMGSTAAATEIHPLYHQTQADLGALLSQPCTESHCPMEDRFQQWAMQYNKPYITVGVSDGDEAVLAPAEGAEKEYDYRLKAFASNVALAKSFNEESQGAATFGITKFMDMPEKEFMTQRGGMAVDSASKEKIKSLPKATIGFSGSPQFLGETRKLTEGKKDWAADGFTTAVKDQGQCGSCWAFSTVEQVESMAIKEGLTDPTTGDNYVLAPQELVSCDHNGDQGCGGGLPVNALEWLEKKALERESDYPYKSGLTQLSGKCKAKKSLGVMEVSSYKQISSSGDEEDDLKDYVLNEGPASVGVDANAKWQLYQGGVLKASDCMGQLDHAVQVVGWDTEKEEIKVRNSWAADWGEDGFIRLTAGTNTCGVANMAVTAVVKTVEDSSASSTMTV